MSYRSYMVEGPSDYCHHWRGFATLIDTFDVQAASESDLRLEINREMDGYIETHSPFALDHDGDDRDG